MPFAPFAERLLTRLLVWAALFPYITFVPFLRVDTQPWALMIAGAGVILLADRLQTSLLHFATFTLCIIAVLMFIIDVTNVSSLRTVAGYISMFFISLMATHAFRVDERATLRAIDIGLLCWLAVGVIQRFIDRDAFTWIISDVRSTGLRGITGLAPEPTIFASTLLLMVLWRALIEVRPWHVGVVIVTTFVLASSSQVAIIVIAAAGIFALTSIARPAYILPSLGIAVGAIGAVIALAFYLPPTRLGTLAALVINNPQLLLADESANERAVHIFAGIYSVWSNSFLPAGIDGERWLGYVNSIVQLFPDVFWVPQHSDRILSALGALLFQMGFVALIPIYAIVVSILRWERSSQYKIVWFSVFGLVFLTALPLAHPLIGAVLGGLAYVGGSRRPAAPHGVCAT